MRLPLFSITIMTRRLAALALVGWLGGLGCVLGCEFTPSVRASDESSAANQEARSCLTAAKGNCCHSQQAKSNSKQLNARTAPQTVGEMSCCPIAGQSAVVISKPRRADAPVLAPTSITFPVAPRVERRDASFAARQHVPDRGSTYLRCCVFLI